MNIINKMKNRMGMQDIIRLEKHNWIANHVAGKSFIDVGGLWGTINETVTIAALSGAKEYTMSDVMPLNHENWTKFENRCIEREVTGYKSLRLDICDEEQVSKMPVYDFVHCAGIMYHVSDPIQFIQNLITISGEYLIVGSMTIPEEIETSVGNLSSPVGTSHLIPALGDDSRKILEQFFKENNIKQSVAQPKQYSDLFRPDRHVKTGPWWWIYSPNTMQKMLETCGLEIIHTHTSKNGIFTNILCKIKPI